MNIDSNWVGIKDCIDNPLMSLDKYGFATNSSPDHEDIYDCILPDADKEGCFIHRQISFNDVKKIIDSHPEIPIKETEKKKANIGYLLYMIDLYCDIYDLIDLSGDPCFHRVFINMVEDKSSLDDDTKLRRPNRPWKMTRTDALKVFKFFKGRGYYPYTGHLYFLRDVPEIDLVECLDILSKYGSSKYKFIDMFRYSDDGELYFKRNKSYFKLKD